MYPAVNAFRKPHPCDSTSPSGKTRLCVSDLCHEYSLQLLVGRAGFKSATLPNRPRSRWRSVPFSIQIRLANSTRIPASWKLVVSNRGLRE